MSRGPTMRSVMCFLCLAASLLVGEEFSFSADTLSATLARGKEKTILKGNAKVVSGARIMTAETIELSGPDFRYVLCTGGVVFQNPEDGLYIQAERLFHDRETEKTHIEGNILLEDKKNNTVIRAHILDYDERSQQAFIQIGVRIFKEDITGRGEFAHYDRDKEILTLSGSPVLYKKHDEYRATRVIVHLDTDEVEMEGRIEGTILQEEEEAQGPHE